MKINNLFCIMHFSFIIFIASIWRLQILTFYELFKYMYVVLSSFSCFVNNSSSVYWYFVFWIFYLIHRICGMGLMIYVFFTLLFKLNYLASISRIYYIFFWCIKWLTLSFQMIGPILKDIRDTDRGYTYFLKGIKPLGMFFGANNDLLRNWTYNLVWYLLEFSITHGLISNPCGSWFKQISYIRKLKWHMT